MTAVRAIAKPRDRAFGSGLLLSLALAGSATQAFAVQRSVTLTQVVNQADPGLQWAAPATIPYGEMLDSTTLSAIAAVPGAFVYAPAAGTILLPGTHTLSVTFTPLDPGYGTSSLSVALTVASPGSSTFQLQLADTQTSAIILLPNRDTIVLLSVLPSAGFHQPISFACSSTSVVACTFTPAVVRPTTAPVQVLLTLHSIQLATGGTSPPFSGTSVASATNPGGSPPHPFLACAALLAGLGIRRKLSSRLRRLALPAALLVLLPLCSAGLGCGASFRTSTVTITATSLMETRTLDIDVNLPSR